MIAGMTRLTPMLAVLRIPHLTLLAIDSPLAFPQMNVD